MSGQSVNFACGTFRTSRDVRYSVAYGGKAEIMRSWRAFPLLTDAVEKVGFSIALRSVAVPMRLRSAGCWY
jgi:hypothetical protein